MRQNHAALPRNVGLGVAGVVLPDFRSSQEDEGCLEEAVASVH